MSKNSSNVNLKWERAEKVLLWKLDRLGKCGAKMYSKCMMPNPKAYSSKKNKKFHGIDVQKLSYIDQSMKKEVKWKAFNHCKHFGEESYTFISTTKIGHLTSCYLCIAICVWLDWIDHWSFILNYGLIHTWYSHTTHKSNVQWISISFVWLYMFECDVCVLKLIMIESKRFFDHFICFWKWFISPMFFKVFQVNFVWKTWFLGVFVTHFASSISLNPIMSFNSPIFKFFNFEQRVLRLVHNLKFDPRKFLDSFHKSLSPQIFRDWFASQGLMKCLESVF